MLLQLHPGTGTGVPVALPGGVGDHATRIAPSEGAGKKPGVFSQDPRSKHSQCHLEGQ